MTHQNEEARRLADDLDTESAGNKVSNYNTHKAAALLRSQAAEIERLKLAWTSALNLAENIREDRERASALLRDAHNAIDFMLVASAPMTSQQRQCWPPLEKARASIRIALANTAPVATKFVAPTVEWLAGKLAGGTDDISAGVAPAKTDTELLNFLEAQGSGEPWVARQSGTGRGYRLHNDKDGKHATARAAIAGAMAEPVVDRKRPDDTEGGGL